MNWIKSIKDYTPYNEQEAKDKDLILKACENNTDLLTRENKVMHITSSAYIVNKSRDKVLMIYHKIYKSWAWTGGHADGEEKLLNVAVKEAKEETGLKNVSVVTNDIFSLEIISVQGHVKKGEYVSPHLHLNITYLLEADENEELVINEEETNGVKWIRSNELYKYCNEEFMLDYIYFKLNQKLNLQK